MTDALIAILNDRGYQPFSAARTNVEPPDILTVKDGDLCVWGPLAKFCAGKGKRLETLACESGRGQDFMYSHTSKKSVVSAAGCLRNLLQSLGLTSIPKLDLSFCGDSRVSFFLQGVTYRRVVPVDLEPYEPPPIS